VNPCEFSWSAGALLSVVEPYPHSHKIVLLNAPCVLLDIFEDLAFFVALAEVEEEGGFFHTTKHDLALFHLSVVCQSSGNESLGLFAEASFPCAIGGPERRSLEKFFRMFFADLKSLYPSTASHFNLPALLIAEILAYH